MAQNWNDWNRNDFNRYDRGDERQSSFGNQDRYRADEGRYGSDRNFDNQSTYRSGEQERGQDRNTFGRNSNERSYDFNRNESRPEHRDWGRNDSRTEGRNEWRSESRDSNQNYQGSNRDWSPYTERDTNREFGYGMSSGYGANQHQGSTAGYYTGSNSGFGTNTGHNTSWGQTSRQNQGWGQSAGQHQGQNFGQSYGQNYGQNQGYYQSQNHGYNQGQNFNQNQGSGHNYDYRSGSDYGSYGRDDRFGSFGHRDDQNRTGMFGGGYGRGTETSRAFTTEMGYGGGFTRDTQVSSQGWGLGSNMDQSRTQRGQFSGRGPKGWRRSDDRIREDVNETLEMHPEIDASEIEVDVKDGFVTLKGHAVDRRQKRLAEDIIESCAGVRDVRNEITVNTSFFEKAKEMLMGETSTETAKTEKTTRSGSKH